MDAKTAIEELLKRWGEECATIEAERQVLQNASEILGDDLLKHSIELWDMKKVRLQQCAIDVQGVIIRLNCERERELVMSNDQDFQLAEGGSA